MKQVVYITNENELQISVTGRIDAANASEIEKEIISIKDNNPGLKIVIDAHKLDYISSAGLRIILRLRKEDSGLKIINASSDVYEIFDMTGFTDMVTIEKAYRHISVDGCEIIGKGANGSVYRLDDEIIVKLYHDPSALDDIRREREIARKAFILGIPTAIPFDIVRVGDSYGAVFELLKATSITKLIKNDSENIDKYVKIFVDLLKIIHSTESKPGDFPQIKETVLGWADFLKGHIPDEQQEKLYRLISEVPEGNMVIHGDYHTNNVMVQNNEPILIDMDTVSAGHPIFELASIFNACGGYSAVEPENVMKFFNISQEISLKIWDKALRLYLESDDEEYIRAVEKKAKLVGFTRVLRRTIRREAHTESGQKLIAYCKEQLSELIPVVDTLEF